MKELVSIRPLLQKAKDELRALAASEIKLARITMKSCAALGHSAVIYAS
jgi:hypothetical protein